MDVTFAKLRKKGWFDEVAGLLLLLFTAITIGALLSYRGTDATWFQSQPVVHRAANWTGRVGATLAELLLQLLGTAAFLVPVVLAVTGWNRFRGTSPATSYARLLGFSALVATLATLLEEKLPERAARVGRHLADGLQGLKARHPVIRDVRGKGLLLGVEMARPAAPVVTACREAGLLILTAGDTVLRLAPPLIVDEATCDRALAILGAALAAQAA